MVYKEELCHWFKNLGPHKRIDFMCEMLQLCLPMELRFIGSYVEDLAKKDFHELRESEGKANNHKELSNFKETDGKKFRSKMAIYLALLHSSNRTCSSILFQLLEKNVKEYFTVMDVMSEMDIHNILLVLAMAMNHPSFSYTQKSKMYEYYQAALKEAGLLRNKHENNSQSSLILSESCDFRACDDHQSPACSPGAQTCSTHSPEPSAKVYVQDIKVKGRHFSEKDRLTEEYRLQVTWSNGEKREVYRTYDQLHDFHNKLLLMFPDEPQCTCKSFSLPAIKGTMKNHSKGTQEHIQVYTESLNNLPGHVVQCQFFSNFFEPIKYGMPVLRADASTSPRPQASIQDIAMETHTQASEEEDPVINMTVKVQTISSTPYLNGEIGDIDNLSPAANSVMYNVSTHSPSISLKMASPLVSSPCQSPISLPSGSSRPPSPSGAPDMPDLSLSALVQEALVRFSREQLEKMNVEELVRHTGRSADVCRDILAAIKINNGESQHVLMASNGLLEHPPWAMQPTHIYPYSQQYGQHHMPPMPFHIARPVYPPVFSYHTVAMNGMRPRDNSSSNSEHSSPSQSPQLPPTGKPPGPPYALHLPPTADSSSDEIDRDKTESQYKVGKKSHSAPNSARLSHHEEDSTQNATSTSPPLYPDKMAAGLSGVYGPCGYTSDPTYNAPRPLLPRPAHVNVCLPQNIIINMPDSQKCGPRHMIPSAIPQHLQGFMGLPNHYYNMAANDRQFYQIRHSPPSPHFPSMNVGRPIHSNSAPPMNPNPSVNISNTANNVCNTKVFQSPGVIPPVPGVGLAPKVPVIVNGSDSMSTGPHPQVLDGIRPGPAIACSTSDCISTSSGPSVSPAMASSRPSCSSCGCPGAHNPLSTAISPGVWQPYHNGFMPHPQMLMHQSPYPNGYSPDLIHPPVMNHMLPAAMMAGANPMYSYNLWYQTSRFNNKKPKKLTCDNCGSPKHTGAECTEASMEAMSGPSLYSYQPKMESD